MSGFLRLGAATTYFAIEAGRPDENGNRKPWDVFANAYLAAGSYFVALTHAVIPAPDVWGLKRIGKQTSSTEEERRAKLRNATETLQKSAAIEEFMGGPLGIVSGAVFGIVGGSVKAAKWPGKTPGTTAVLFLLPPIISTANVLTSPRHSIEGWESYRGIACSSKYYDKGSEGAALDFSLNPLGSSFTWTF